MISVIIILIEHYLYTFQIKGEKMLNKNQVERVLLQTKRILEKDKKSLYHQGYIDALNLILSDSPISSKPLKR